MVISNQCNSTLDCVLNEPVPKECFVTSRISNLTQFCDCSPLFGWSGVECDKPGDQTNFIRVNALLVIIWLSVVNYKLVSLFYKAYKLNKKSVQGAKRALLQITLDFVAASFTIIGAALLLQHYFDSSGYSIQESEG